MYNNIGLQTPRGSGTSGYIMANKAKAKPQRSRLEFLKELKQLRENVLPPPRKANPDIINHMEKREIYVKLAQMRATLTAQGDLGDDEIEQQLKQTEEELLRKFQNGELRQALAKDGKDAIKDTHALALIKEQEQSRLKNAFRVDGKYEFGSAFDFDNQEKVRLEKAYKREVTKMEQAERKKIESAKRKAEAKQKKQELKEKAKKEAKKKDRSSSSSSSGSSSSSSGSNSSSGSGSSSSSGSRSSSGSSSESQEKKHRKAKKDGDKRKNLKASSGRGDKRMSQDKHKGDISAKEASKTKDQHSTNKNKSEKRQRSRSRDKGTDRKKPRSSSSRSGRH